MSHIEQRYTLHYLGRHTDIISIMPILKPLQYALRYNDVIMGTMAFQITSLIII